MGDAVRSRQGGHSHATYSGCANWIGDGGSASPWRDARRRGIGGRRTQISQQGGVLEPCPRVAGSAPEVRLRSRARRRDHGPAHESGDPEVRRGSSAAEPDPSRSGHRTIPDGAARVAVRPAHGSTPLRRRSPMRLYNAGRRQSGDHLGERGDAMAKLLDGMERMVRGEAPPPPAAMLLGMRLESFSPGEAVVALDATEAHGNPMGTVQGGILAAIADAAMGWAFMTTLGENESYTTLEVKVNFLRPVWAGRLEARGRVKNAGRSVALVECDVLSAGKLVAYGVSTCMTLRGEQATGR